MEPFFSVLLAQDPTNLSRLFGGFAVTTCVKGSSAGNKPGANESSLPLCRTTCPEKFCWQTLGDPDMHPRLILASPHHPQISQSCYSRHAISTLLHGKGREDRHLKVENSYCNSRPIFGLQISNYLLDSLAFT